MDRRSKVNELSAGGSPPEGAKSKEVALEKLRKMEWKRNQQDGWHLARSNSRGEDVQEKKKYNKNEDNYFEGTGVQKTKKFRRPRTSESSPAVPPGFNVAQPSSGAPQVNAWAQKKGSALFQKKDEVDEEDQLLSLVLEESRRTAEEDEKRRLEWSRMANLDLQPSTHVLCAEKNWEEEYGKNHSYTENNSSEFQEDSPKSELHFVETDPKEETPVVSQRHRSIPSRNRKISPREKSSGNSSNNSPEVQKKAPSFPMNKNTHLKENTAEDNGDFFEPSRPQAKYSPVEKINEIDNASSFNITPSKPNPLRTHAGLNTDDLSMSFNTTLTFGDTQGLFDKIRDNNDLIQNSNNETSLNANVASDMGENKPFDPSEPSETDILLHNFIRHEPPSNLHPSVQSNVPDMSAIKQSDPNNLFGLSASPTFSTQSLNLSQNYLSQQMAITEQNPIMNGLVGALPGGIQISNGRDSSSSLSGSPLQNITPVGSFEKDTPSNLRAGVQTPANIGVPYPYLYGVENSHENYIRQLQAMQLMNQNPAPVLNTEYSSLIRGVVPANPQMGQPQFRLPSSNLMPTYQGQNMLLHQLHQQVPLQQMHMQQAYNPAMLALDPARLQQQRAGVTTETEDNATKEEVNITQQMVQNSILAQNQPQIHNSLLAQNQPQTQNLLDPNQVKSTPLLTHPQMLANHQHLLQLANHPQLSMYNQPQTIPSVETPKQQELQQNALQGLGQTVGKTAEELRIELQNALDAVKRVSEQLQGQTMPWGGIPPSPGIPVANQFFPQIGMIPHSNPQYIHQIQVPGMIPPTVSVPQNVPVSMSNEPELNLGREPSPVQEGSQAEPRVGRGRGRIQ